MQSDDRELAGAAPPQPGLDHPAEKHVPPGQRHQHQRHAGQVHHLPAGRLRSVQRAEERRLHTYTAIETACWNGRTADGLRWVHTSYHSNDDVCPYLSKAQVLGFIAEVTKLAKR